MDCSRELVLMSFQRPPQLNDLRSGAAHPVAGTGKLVSVIVPTYNYGHLIRDALESLLSQSYPKLEIVVVDDGSTDDTPTVIGSLPGEVEYVRCPHRGVSAARNTGLRVSRGEYVAFLDADDVLCPESIALRAAVLDQHDDIALVFSDVSLFDASGTIADSLLGTKKHFSRLQKHSIGNDAYRLEGDVFAALIRDRFITIPSVMARRVCLEEVGGFDESLEAQEDWDLWVRAIENMPIAYLARVLASCRQHDRNLSGNSRLIAATHVQFIRKLLSNGCGGDASRRSVLRKRLSTYLFELGYVHFSADRVREALPCFVQGMCAWPIDWRLWAYGAACAIPARVRKSLRGPKRRLGRSIRRVQRERR